MDQQISNELPHLGNPELNEHLPRNPVDVPAMLGRTELQGSVAIEHAQTQTSTQAIQTPLPQNFNPQLAVPASGSPQTSNPAIADDADLIEKEWVVKAKEIIARTKNDPYQQNKEVERMKVDYMKKRYNKEVKLTED